MSRHLWALPAPIDLPGVLIPRPMGPVEAEPRAWQVWASWSFDRQHPHRCGAQTPDGDPACPERAAWRIALPGIWPDGDALVLAACALHETAARALPRVLDVRPIEGDTP